jgi:hypothetical protein
MFRQGGNLGGWGRLLLALLILCLLPCLVQAETLEFRNDCKAPVVVQAVSVFRGVLRRDRPYLLNPGDKTPGITMLGDKVITVYNARIPNQILFQGAIPSGMVDLSFSILPDLPGPKVRMEQQRPGMAPGAPGSGAAMNPGMGGMPALPQGPAPPTLPPRRR